MIIRHANFILKNLSKIEKLIQKIEEQRSIALKQKVKEHKKAG